MTVLGVIAKFLTFPGALLHAFWEHLVCRVYRCPIEDGRYLRTDEMCGHVEHELMDSTARRFFLAFFPFLFQVILGFFIAVPAAMAVFTLGEYKLGYFVLLWVGISLLANAFPSVEDALAMWEAIYTRDGGIAMAGKVLLAPIAAVLYAGAYLNHWGATLLTGAAAGIFLPQLFRLFL